MLMELIRRLVSVDPRVRDNAADEITDILRDLDAQDATTLAHVLVTARLVEPDPRCREAQLHALNELNEWFPLSSELLSRLRYLDPGTIEGSQVEYLTDLLNDH